MVLSRLGDFESQPNNVLGSQVIRQFVVYSAHQELLGKVVDGLLDETGHFHYLVVELHPTIAQKQVLLPMSQAELNLQTKQVHLVDLSAAQFVNLPTYQSQSLVQPDPLSSTRSNATTYSDASVSPPTIVLEEQPLEMSAPLEAPFLMQVPASRVESPQGVMQSNAARLPMDEPAPTASEPLNPRPPIDDSTQVVMEPPVPGVVPTPPPSIPPYSSSPDVSPNSENQSISFEIQRDFNRADEDEALLMASAAASEEQIVQLLEERLVADRKRRKAGEVIVRKEVETRMVQVPLRREKLIVEQVSPRYRQLAVVHLPQASDAVQLADAATTADASGTKIVREFPSIEAAQQFLQGVAVRPDLSCERVQISIVLG